MIDFMKATYETALNCGLPIIPLDTAARIFAVVYVHGNNEFMVHSPKFNVEREYIQKRFHIEGGEIPDRDFVIQLKSYIKELEEYEEINPDKRYPQWAKDLFMQRYGFQLIN